MSQCFVAAGGFLFTSVSCSIVRPSAYANKRSRGRFSVSSLISHFVYFFPNQTDFDRHRQINRHATDDDARCLCDKSKG